MGTLDAAIPPAKLPLGQTISQAYSSYIKDFPDLLLRASWLWLLVVGVTTAATYATSWRSPVQFLQLLATAQIAVAWHRRLIIGESPGFAGSNATGLNLWRYIVAATLLFLITFVPLILVGGFGRSLVVQARNMGLGSLESIWLLLLRLAAIAVTVILTCRVSLVLPARAIGQREPTLREAWACTRYNTWPLFCGGLATSLPLLLVTQLFAPGIPVSSGVKIDTASMTTSDIANAVANAVLYMLAVQVSVGFLSYAYRHFYQRTDHWPE